MRNTILVAIGLTGCVLAGCGQKYEPSRTRTATGVLKHYPSNVRSREAWYGHKYMVGDTPVLPTEEVPEEMLQRHVGQELVVKGTWHPGKRYQPTPEERNLPRPVDIPPEGVIRGDGLRAVSISPVRP